ncbi:Outer envelope protein 64, chloroplastic [Linum perenne]
MVSSPSSPANLWVLLGLGLAGIFLLTRRLKKAVREDFGAFVQKLQLLPPPQPSPPKARHPLTGLTFAVSDVFDIEGFVTGCGHPDWARTHGSATQTAAVISKLVEGGATCVGKTVVDELAYSINGENKHYGTPTNPAAPAHVPGGSSSGSAVAVAAKLVDFSLGVDTVGGVRVPATFCGVIGYRPSYGALSNMGMFTVSPSLDTVGLFTNDPDILRCVGNVLLQLPFGSQRKPRQIIIADDTFERFKIPFDRLAQALIKSTEKIFGSDDGILVIPTTVYLPPKLNAKEMLLEDYKTRSFSLLSLASLSGSCQVTIPMGKHGKCPTSVSFIARQGGDRLLLDTLQSMFTSLQEQADILSTSKKSSHGKNPEISADEAKEKGNQAFKEKQWQKAIGFYTEAIKLNDSNATYYSNRAAAYLEIASFPQAETDCSKAIDLDKKNVKAYLRRGTAREMLGYYKEALEDFRYASVLEPTNKRAAASAERLRKVFQ